MPFRPCPSGCGRFLSADDGHDRCLQCLGFQHVEDAFVDDSCACCGRMSMISLRSRLSFMKGLAPAAATRAGLSASRGSPAGTLGDLRVTVRASLPGTPSRTSYSSRSEHPVRFPGDFAGLSHGAPSISFGAPSVDRMSIAASGDGFTSSEDEGAVGLPPSGVVATAATDPELTAMLARAAVSIGLEVNSTVRRKSRCGPSGKAMSTMVVQERYLWLTLVKMKDVDKAHFLDAPISQPGLFGDTVEGFAQQFSAVQQQTEVIQHTCPDVMHHPPLPPGPGFSLPIAVGALLRPPELLRPRPNRYLGRRVEPLTGLVCSDRPEGCLLSCFDPSATQTVPTVCVRRSGMAVQGPPLRAFPVSPCVHEGRRRRPYPVTGVGCQDPQLHRRLAYPSPIQRAVRRSQGLGAPALQPVGASGQLGKEQVLPCAENLFSRCGVRLGEYDGTPHGGTC